MGTKLLKFTKPKRFVSRVFIHCSASDRLLDDNVETIDEWHKERGWKEIGYNFYIDRKGMVWQGRDIENIPAAQQGYNTNSIAICCGGAAKFTELEFNALKKLCEDINISYKGKISFHGHCEVNRHKTCPNFDYVKILGLSNQGFMIGNRR